MAIYTLKDIERLRVCPILFEQKEDYSPISKGSNALFRFAINDIFKWYGRRGYRITDSTVISTLSNYAFSKNVDMVEATKIEQEILQLMKTVYYQNIDRPIVNQDISLNLTNGNLVKHRCAPFFHYRKHYYLIKATDEPVDFMFLMRDLETRLSLYWIARTFQDTPYLLNFYRTKDGIKSKRIKVSPDYMMDIEKELKSLKSFVDNPLSKIIPCSEICKRCNWRTKCLTIQRSKLSLFAKQMPNTEEQNRLDV